MVTIAALEIMKLIMDVALLGVPSQRGDSRLLKLRIEKFKSNQFIADNLRSFLSSCAVVTVNII